MRTHKRLSTYLAILVTLGVGLTLLYLFSPPRSYASHTASGAWVEDPAITGCNHCHNTYITAGNSNGTTRTIAYTPSGSSQSGSRRNSWGGAVTYMAGKGCPVADTTAATTYLNTCYCSTCSNPNPQGFSCLYVNQPPSQSTNVAGTSASSGLQITLTWNASTDDMGVAGYNIYRDYGLTPIGTASVTTYTDSGLIPGASYTYEVEAYDAYGIKSAKSTPVIVTTSLPMDLSPSTPDNLTGLFDRSGTKVFLTWAPATDDYGVVSYNIYRNGGGTPVGSATKTSFLDTGLTVGSSYSYEIEAVDSGGNPSLKSSPLTVIPLSSQSTMRVSLDSNNGQGNGDSSHPSSNADGKMIAFSSGASNLVDNDTNSCNDIFVRSLVTGITERVSVDSSGAQVTCSGGESSFPSISADSEDVAFLSNSTNLVTGDTNSVRDVFVRDRTGGITERASVSSSEVQANYESAWSSISADGRYLSFDSLSTNLVSGDTNGRRDVFVRDLQTGTTERVSVNSSEVQHNGLYSSVSSISADGRYVAFTSDATNLITGDDNGSISDIFVRDRQSGTTSRVSVNSSGTGGDGASMIPYISADGRYVAFLSDATNLVTGDSSWTRDIFVHDRQTGNTEWVSVNSNEIPGDNHSWSASISADGRYVAFESSAANLATGDSNGVRDIFVRDLQTGTTERVSIDGSGAQGNGDSIAPSISGDGRYVAFESAADNLVFGDTNGVSDIFVRDRGGSDQDGDNWYIPEDCNDNDNTIYPAATEVPNDGIDQDCSGADLAVEARLDQGTSGDQRFPWVDYNESTNEYLVLWQDKRSGNDDIYGSRMDRNGNKLGSDIAVSTASGHQQRVLVKAGGGGYLALWHDLRNQGTNGADIYGAWIAGDGTVGAEMAVCACSGYRNRSA